MSKKIRQKTDQLIQGVQVAVPLAAGNGTGRQSDHGGVVNAIKAMEARIRELEAHNCAGCPMLDTRAD